VLTIGKKDVLFCILRTLSLKSSSQGCAVVWHVVPAPENRCFASIPPLEMLNKYSSYKGVHKTDNVRGSAYHHTDVKKSGFLLFYSLIYNHIYNPHI
jgi:hypothetical protein